jgi:hypothetical protein
MENVKLCAQIYFIFLAQFTSKIYFPFSLIFLNNFTLYMYLLPKISASVSKSLGSFPVGFFAKL